MPPSVRYLGRRVYLGAVVVLVTAMLGGITATRAAQLREWLGVSVRTLKRWRAWWRETFVASVFWRGAQGRFMPPVAIEALPASLLERFAGDEVVHDACAAYMRAHGLRAPAARGRATRHRGRGAPATGSSSCEVRSFEVEHVGALWHLDFHHGSRKVLTRAGQLGDADAARRSSTTARAWSATCSGTSTRRPRAWCTACRRRS